LLNLSVSSDAPESWAIVPGGTRNMAITIHAKLPIMIRVVLIASPFLRFAEFHTTPKPRREFCDSLFRDSSIT